MLDDRFRGVVNRLREEFRGQVLDGCEHVSAKDGSGLQQLRDRIVREMAWMDDAVMEVPQRYLVLEQSLHELADELVRVAELRSEL